MESNKRSIEEWESFKSSLEIGREVIGTVELVKPYGIFVNFGANFIGLIDVGHWQFGQCEKLPNDRGEWPSPGTSVKCCVNYFRDDNQQVGLGLLNYASCIKIMVKVDPS